MTASIDNEGTPSETALETFREEEFEDSKGMVLYRVDILFSFFHFRIAEHWRFLRTVMGSEA